jgi:glucuronokinase
VSSPAAALQVYGGVVYMDFNSEHMQTTGCGIYESLKPELLPRLWLIYCDNPSDSGKVHSTVKQRWLAGDAAVVQGMQQVAQCAAEGRWVVMCVCGGGGAGGEGGRNRGQVCAASC